MSLFDVPSGKYHRRENEIFTAGEDWYSRACILQYHPGWDYYAWGFKRSADTLVSCLVNDNSHIDSIVYPVCFLYRHYIELRLKEILVEGDKLLDVSRTIPATHNLIQLWSEVKKIVAKLFPEGDKSELLLVEKLIKYFSEVDSKSLSFRYPVDIANNPSLSGVEYINIVDLKSGVDKIECLLEGVSTAISVYLDIKDEMISNYSD